MTEEMDITAFCKNCNSEIPYENGISKCPFCNSDNIMIKCSIFEKISIKGSEFCEYQGKDSSLKSKDKKRLWGKMGMVKSQKTPTGNAYLERHFNRDEDLYYENVTDENGNEIHHCQEKLSKHIGHGSAKKNNNKI